MAPGVAGDGGDGLEDILNFEAALGGAWAAADGTKTVAAIDWGVVDCAAVGTDVSPERMIR
jgi:hypothetical protein